MNRFLLRHRALLSSTAIVAVATVATPAFAQLRIVGVFNGTTYGGYSVAQVQGAFNTAAFELQNSFHDPITITINVVGNTSGLASSSSALQPGNYTYAQIKTALTNDNTAHPSPDGTTSIANLPGADPTTGGNFRVTTAQAKALSLIANNNNVDGTISFNRTQTYTFGPRAAAGAFDFIGIMEHEISEVMGRVDGLNQAPGNFYTVNDLFRYTVAGGNPNFAVGAANPYLSIDGGTTNLMGFNTDPTKDLEDYNGGTATDPYNASTPKNQAHAFSGVDVTNLDVIGYDVRTPEPSSLVFAGTLLLSGSILRRKRTRKTA